MDSYEAVVVGAGPAGAGAALTLARGGVSVLLLEKGQYPGSKNVFGGTVYSQPTLELIPAFWQQAPLERAVVTDELWFMETDSAVKVGFSGKKFGREPFNKFTALRSLFDAWFAGQAVQAGAVMRTSAKAVDLVYEVSGPLRTGRRVAGVKLDTGEVIRADVVILAEGVLASLSRKAGLRGRLPAHTLNLYVKEVISLPADKIEDRFQLEKDQGCLIGIVGYPTAGAIGKGAVYTNRNSLSVFVGAPLNQLIDKGLSPFVLLQRLKNHPLIRRLLQGGETVEYQAHLIPKGGYKQLPKLFRDGLLVAGDAAVMISGRQGMDLAMLTGKYAAETVLQAHAKGDFSSQLLAAYQRKIETTYFFQDIKQNRGIVDYYRRYQDVDYLLSNVLNETAYQFFSIDLVPETQRREKILQTIGAKQTWPKTADDIYHGLKYWGVF